MDEAGCLTGAAAAPAPRSGIIIPQERGEAVVDCDFSAPLLVPRPSRGRRRHRSMEDLAHDLGKALDDSSSHAAPVQSGGLPGPSSGQQSARPHGIPHRRSHFRRRSYSMSGRRPPKRSSTLPCGAAGNGAPRVPGCENTTTQHSDSESSNCEETGDHASRGESHAQFSDSDDPMNAVTHSPSSGVLSFHQRMRHNAGSVSGAVGGGNGGNGILGHSLCTNALGSRPFNQPPAESDSWNEAPSSNNHNSTKLSQNKRRRRKCKRMMLDTSPPSGVSSSTFLTIRPPTFLLSNTGTTSSPSFASLSVEPSLASPSFTTLERKRKSGETAMTPSSRSPPVCSEAGGLLGAVSTSVGGLDGADDALGRMTCKTKTGFATSALFSSYCSGKRKRTHREVRLGSNGNGAGGAGRHSGYGKILPFHKLRLSADDSLPSPPPGDVQVELSSTSSVSSSESDTGVATNDEGREADDEQSDWVQDSGSGGGPTLGIPFTSLKPPLLDLQGMSPSTQQAFLSKLNNIQLGGGGISDREILSGRRTLRDNTVRSSFDLLRPSVNEEISRFLRSPTEEDLVLGILTGDESPEVTRLAHLYSLIVRIDPQAGMVLTKTPLTLQRIHAGGEECLVSPAMNIPSTSTDQMAGRSPGQFGSIGAFAGKTKRRKFWYHQSSSPVSVGGTEASDHSMFGGMFSPSSGGMMHPPQSTMPEGSPPAWGQEGPLTSHAAENAWNLAAAHTVGDLDSEMKE